MSLLDRKKAKTEFCMELEKQTEPYAYFIIKEEEEIRGVLTTSSPLYSIVEFDAAFDKAPDKAETDKDQTEDIFSFMDNDNGNNKNSIYDKNNTCNEINTGKIEKEHYIVFKNRNGKIAEGGIENLLNQLNSENDEKLNADLIYCDEDFIDGKGVRHTPWMKPDWSPDTLLSCNYIGNLFAVRLSVAKQVEVLSKEQEADDAVRIYDFLLKYTEIANKITHVSETLFHRDESSVYSSVNNSSASNSLTNRCADQATDQAADRNADHDTLIYQAFVSEYQKDKYTAVRNAAFARRGFRQPAEQSKKESVSIVIPSKDHADILIRCLQSIKNKGGFNIETAVEIIIVDNGSCEEEKNKITHYIERNVEPVVSYLYDPAPFNYSKMCHMGAKQANGNYLLFLNDDIEALDGAFIEKMLYYASAPHVGAVGAKLYYPDSDIIQHAGVTNLICGPSHKLATHSDSEIYYFGRNRFNMDVLAVTGACMMLSKEKYFNVGGFSDRMEVSYNDIDLCVNLYERGYFNVILNDCILYHHESLSRGTDMADDKKYVRLHAERKLFYERHSWLLNQNDPFYNRHLLQDTLDFRPNVQAEYEKRDYRNDKESLAKLPGNMTEKQEKIQTKLEYHIEQTGFERALDSTVEDAYRIEGWGILLKEDNAVYERFLVLIPVRDGKLSVGEGMQFRLSPRYREDVKQVFPKAKNAELAGFVCRIGQSYLGDMQTYRIGMLFVSRLRKHKKYIMLGDYYAAERRERKLCKRE